MRLPIDVEQQFIQLSSDKGVLLEGNILKVLEGSDDFLSYLEVCKAKDKETREKRLNVAKSVQQRCQELEIVTKENETLMEELQVALNAAEQAKTEALNEVSVLQKRAQFQLIGDIVKVALFVIVTVGVIVTMMYVLAMMTESPETTLIGNTWSNLFGILLTNSFSIIGTIMGVKYADDRKGDDKT